MAQYAFFVTKFLTEIQWNHKLYPKHSLKLTATYLSASNLQCIPIATHKPPSPNIARFRANTSRIASVCIHIISTFDLELFAERNRKRKYSFVVKKMPARPRSLCEFDKVIVNISTRCALHIRRFHSLIIIIMECKRQSNGVKCKQTKKSVIIIIS